MGMEHRRIVPLSQVATLFPAMADQLPAINEALRRINMGRMEFLPYENPITGYELHMRAKLTPQGEGRPPQVGHWQLEVAGPEPCVLYLHGKVGEGGELGELAWPPGSAPDAEEEPAGDQPT